MATIELTVKGWSLEPTASTIDDPETLIRLARSGDGSAWKRLLDPLQQPVYLFLCRSVSSSDANDILQLTLMNVFRKIDQCQQPTRFKSWVFQIAYRQMLNFLRKNNHPVHNTKSLDFDPESHHSERKDRQAESQLEDLRSAIDQLPEEIRQVVWLRLKEEMPFKQISEVTGSPLGTVLGRMKQGKQKLKEILSGQ